MIKSLKTFSENIDDKSKEELEAEELDRMFKKLKNKKILLEAEKLERKLEILKNRKLVKVRIDALRKRLNNSDDNDKDNDKNDNDENVVNLDNMNFNDLLSNPNMTLEIAEELGKY